jgi:4-hydroxy-tetrahydrodipicolinate synthase
MKKFTGAITALVTPFTTSGTVDYDALRSLVQFQLDGGIDALVPCGSTGEAVTLNTDEYTQVIKTVVTEVAGKIPVIAGAGSNDTQKAITFSRLAKEAGADGLLHVTPFYNKPTPNGIVAHFKAIADEVALPIILYNVPGRTGSNISAALTLRVAKEVEQVVAVKEASGDLGQMMEIIKNASADFTVLSGDDALTLPLLSVGGDGCISVVANEVPLEFAQLVHTALSGDFATAKEIHYKIFALMNANFSETNPIPVKTALALMGKIKEQFRLPLVPMEDKNRTYMQEVLKGLELL